MSLLQDLQSYYKLDGNSTDAHGSNDGSDTNITYSEANGKIVQGAGFNGTTSKIVLGTPITMPTNLSISAWVKKTDNVGDDTIFGDSHSTSNPQWCFYDTAGGKLYFQWYSASGVGRVYATDNVVVGDTNWHFVAVTQTGTGAPTFYVDGSAVDSSLIWENGADTKPSAQGSAIGRLGAYDGGYFNGAIDEVGIWERALDSTEVGQLYNSGNGLAYPLEYSSSSSSSFSSSSFSSSSSSSESISSSSSSLSSSSISSSSSSESAYLDTWGIAWGEENPDADETPESWALWSDGAGGSHVIVGDPDWGKLQLGKDEVANSPVHHFIALDSQTILTQNKYGLGLGSFKLYYRESDDAFGQDDISPSWNLYTNPIRLTKAYRQIRLVGE